MGRIHITQIRHTTILAPIFFKTQAVLNSYGKEKTRQETKSKLAESIAGIAIFIAGTIAAGAYLVSQYTPDINSYLTLAQ